MAKEKNIVINEWQRGIGLSPYVGFEDVKNLNIEDKPGAIYINTKLTAMGEDTGNVNDLITWFDTGRTGSGSFKTFAIQDGAYFYYDVGDSEWKSIAASSYTNGEGMVCWSGSNTDKGYMIVADDAALHALDCSTADGTPSWDYSFKAITDSTWNPMIIGQDNIIYGGNGNNIFTIEEATGETFDPGNSATYTYNSSALDLPSDYEVRCLEELGQYLVIGTYNKINSSSADIFIWDRNASSFDRILRVNSVDGINALITFKNLTYIQAGTKGEWFVTNGSSVEKRAEIPKHLIGDDNYEVKPGAVAIVEGKIYFGLSNYQSTTGSQAGIWSLEPETGQLIYQNQISTGEIGTNDAVKIGAIRATRAGGTDEQGYIASWEDQENSSYGVDTLNTLSHKYSNSDAYLITSFYRVGLIYTNKTIPGTEIYLSKPLASGQSIKIQYRSDQSAVWTDYETFNTANKQEFRGRAIPSVESIQFKIIFDTTADSSSTPELLEFRTV